MIGYGALVSFGHAAFIGLGAYTVGILGAHGVNDALITLPLALAVSALFAWATGIVCLRTKGVYFIMITLAFGQMTYFTASSLAPYGGDDGLTIRMRSTFAGFPILANDRALYYVCLGCLLGTYLLCRALIASRFGRVYRGARENAAADEHHRLRGLSLPARRLRDRRHDRRPVGLPARQRDRLRQPGLHVVAAFGRAA